MAIRTRSAVAVKPNPVIDSVDAQKGISMCACLSLLLYSSNVCNQTSYAADGLIALPARRKGLPCQQDENSHGSAHIEIPILPEDIWRHIHSLMPMRDAARAACVSHSFLSSWRYHPNLNFSSETLGLDKNACGRDKLARVFYGKVDHILKRHSGTGVKKLKIQINSIYSSEGSGYLNNWLQIAVKPGIEELTFVLIQYKANYDFPCSLLSNGSGDSVQYLHLSNCSFHPSVTLGCLRSLTRLHLCLVRITDDELGCLLSYSLALKRLEIRYCYKIVCLKVPCLLQRLRSLEVFTGGAKLERIVNEAPNVSSFAFEVRNTVQLSLGETLQMKSLEMVCPGYVFHACAKLPSSMPNLESLTISSSKEIAPATTLSSKFLYLRHLSIALIGSTFSPAYDYLSLASFINAAPSLENFNLNVWQRYMQNVSIFADSTDLRRMKEAQQHQSLKSVRITAFSSAKSLVELTCHILETATSLEFLTLEALQSCMRCTARGNNTGKCSSVPRNILMEGLRGVVAIRRYIEPRVPPTVKLHVLEPCCSCHGIEL